MDSGDSARPPRTTFFESFTNDAYRIMSDSIPNNSGQPPMRVYDRTPYGYTPTMWICILFVVLYGITSVVHFAQALRYRLWWLIPSAVLCGVGEIIG